MIADLRMVVQWNPPHRGAVDHSSSFGQAIKSLALTGFFIDQRLDKIQYDLSKNLIKKPFIIRNAVLDDLPELIEVESKAWGNLQVSMNELRMRIQRHPTGQWVVVLNDKIIGVLYTQLLQCRDVLLQSTTKFSNQGTLHQVDGSILQLLGVATLPEYSNLQIASTLRYFVINIACCSNINEVVAATRCSNSFSNEELFTTACMNMADPILQFHQSGGAKYCQLLHNYRPDDVNNFGHSILIAYHLNDADQVGTVAAVETPTTSPTKPQKQSSSPLMNNFTISFEQLLNCLNRTLHSNYVITTSQHILDIPFMNLGLDSLQMMEMRSYLLAIEGIETNRVSNTILFDYPTPRQLLQYLNHDERIVSNTTLQCKDSSDVSVIGMSCRFPNNANNTATFFTMLCNKSNFFQNIPIGWKGHTQIAGLLGDEVANTFDPQFFQLSNEEVVYMDPHQRILLEVVYEALLDANLMVNLPNIKHRIGVFIGLCNNEWIRQCQQTDETVSPYLGTGTAQSSAANRISFLLGLSGPSLVVDTACSSSLSAVHVAMTSLQAGDCDIAIVASADLLLSSYSLQVD